MVFPGYRTTGGANGLEYNLDTNSGGIMADEDSGRLSWFLAGAIVGAAVALLYAPKAGKDTRKLISKKSEASRDALTDTGKEVLEKGREFYDKGKEIADDAAELFERGRKLV